MYRNSKIKKVMLTQPNYSISGKRSWKVHPYSLGILNACIKDNYDTELFDPNFQNLSDKEIIDSLKKAKPDVVSISSISTEYVLENEHMTKLVRNALPNAIIVEGGILPTVSITVAMKDKNVDYWVIGEGEKTLLNLLNELNNIQPDLSHIKGLAYFKNGNPKINITDGYIEDLDSIPFPDYGNINFMDYANQQLKYGQGICARRFPYATTITSRGCPYRCIFCSGPIISGKKVRMRSVENVLKEIDELYKQGIVEIIFLDDHFFFNRKRAIGIMKGIMERGYDNLIWKCANLTLWLLDEEILDLMKKSGCYQMTVSIESGNQYVLKNIIKKPIDLGKIPDLLDIAKSKGFEIIANFVVGFPYETWDQIRETFAFAERLNVDLVNFHIATPLPNTELMDICIKEGYVSENFDKDIANVGYTSGNISTENFTPQELAILRAFEWDRINFRSEERKKAIAKIQGISMEELEQWRKDTRRKIGINVLSSNRLAEANTVNIDG